MGPEEEAASAIGQLGRVIFYGRITVHEVLGQSFTGKKDLVINNILHIKSLSPAPTPTTHTKERLHTQQSRPPCYPTLPDPANSFSNTFKSQVDFAGSTGSPLNWVQDRENTYPPPKRWGQCFTEVEDRAFEDHPRCRLYLPTDISATRPLGGR